MNIPNLIRLTETESTNSYLKQLALHNKPDEWTTVISDYQSQGRGQRGNSWEAEPGKNLLMSLILYPEFIANDAQFLISKITAIALCDTFREYAEGFSIKWPNDTYWHDRKIAGTLIESEWIGTRLNHIIIGNGINLNQQQFKSNAPNPVSLLQITGQETSIETFLYRFMDRLAERYHQLRKAEYELINQDYHNRLYRSEGFHRYADVHGEFTARLLHVGNDGRLYLMDETGKERQYWFKEVNYIL